jgi:transposase
MLPKEIQDLIKTLPAENQATVQAIALIYESKIKILEARIKELEDQISKNSRNSSKPPSTDSFFKPPKSLRKKSGKDAGGQKGHQGDSLKMVEHPDKVVSHKVVRCECCHKKLNHQKADRIERRQVYDIPPLHISITEHQSEVKICSCGHTNKSFPTGVDHHVAYGPNIKSMMVYLQNYQLLPYERTTELISDLFNHTISKGTLFNTGKCAYDKLEVFENRLKELLTYCMVAGFDETGFRVMAKRLWLHSCSTTEHAYYEVHEKRGTQAMNAINILPYFKGVAVHDFWRSYYEYGCKHSLCNAHLLRDLIFIKERFEQDWADEMINLLIKMKAAKQRAIDQGKSSLSKVTLKKYKEQYSLIIQEGFKENPFRPPKKKTAGRHKKTPARNLLERLNTYADDILRFLFDFSVPFDNNFSESDIRMMKVKQKISGCFRSLQGANIFTRIRSFIVTARKQKVNVFDALNNLFTDNSITFTLTSSL